MKIISKNQGKYKLKTENLDDLWYLSQIIEKGDFVSGKTFRKIKIGDTDKVVKKQFFLKVQAEKIEFTSNSLRVLGLTVEEKEDIPKGAHHTITLDDSSEFILEKEWLKFQLEKLNESINVKLPKILMLLLDRDEALFVISKRNGYEIITHLDGEVAKKDDRVTIKKSFFEELVKIITEYSQRYNPKHIIIASPSFWKEDLKKLIKDKTILSKIVLASCTSAKESSINEVLRRPETKNILNEDRIAKEAKLVESLLHEISIDNLAVYGEKETIDAVNSGAVKILLISDKKIKEARENETYDLIESTLKTADKLDTEIHILNSRNEPGKKIHSLGGVAGILRYKIR